MRRFLRRRLIDPLLGLLTQGITPQKLALSIAIGGIVGIFPVLGSTTVLVTLAAVALRLNMVAVHTVHYSMTPLQILLIIPFVRVGEHLVGAQPQKLSIEKGMELISHGALNAIVTLWDAIVHAVIGWLALGPAVMVIAYLVFKWLLLRVRLPPEPPPAAEKQA